MLTIDGSLGEGGGQILRTSLALSLCLKSPFRIINIRSGRKKPGLRHQHLAAVKAAAAIGEAKVEGAVIKSPELTFIPQGIVPKGYKFDIGTAGSTTLVLQTVLPALLTAKGSSDLDLQGGTHNPFAPPFDFLNLAFLPLINRMGPKVTAQLERPGFYPAGGGRMQIHIEPAAYLEPLFLQNRGEVLEKQAWAMVANLPESIAQRELKFIGTELGLSQQNLEVRRSTSAKGPGNIVTAVVKSQQITEVFTGFGERGLRAEKVAEKVVNSVRRYLQAGVPVGKYLADQLLLPLALAGGGEYLTLKPSLHTTTNITVIEKFMDLKIGCEEIKPDIWRIAK
jgi:RNA 3'-terminal phosphate cyclase (ATP)